MYNSINLAYSAQHGRKACSITSFELVIGFTLFTELNLLFYSRKHFTEEQAEKWWVENGAKVCERLNIHSSE